MTGRLDDRDVARRLGALPGWRRDGDAIVRSYEFADFGAAFAFMTEVASAAEEQDHHPDWQNSHARVAIRLATHDAGGITERDFRLAETMVAAANRHGGQ